MVSDFSRGLDLKLQTSKVTVPVCNDPRPLQWIMEETRLKYVHTSFVDSMKNLPVFYLGQPNYIISFLSTPFYTFMRAGGR